METFEDEFEDEELDLYKLVSTDSNNLNQYLVFKGSNLEWYAMNVSKIEEVIVYDARIEVSLNNDKDNFIIGTADIRNSMTPLVYFDDWYGNPRLDDAEYELIILANYGGYKLGIIVKEVSSINIIESQNMSDNSKNNLKSTFIAKLQLDGEDQMCTIYDGDQMLLDVFQSVESQDEYDYDKDILDKVRGKVVLFADDSRFVRELVENLLHSLGVKYKIFTDGAYLLEYINAHPKEHVDMFITDLEMPNMGGRELVVSLREKEEYDAVPILIHTNMSNNATASDLQNVGATCIISKMNMQNLAKAITEELTK